MVIGEPVLPHLEDLFMVLPGRFGFVANYNTRGWPQGPDLGYRAVPKAARI